MLSLTTLLMGSYGVESKYLAVVMLTVMTLSMQFSNVITDALMVSAAREDPEKGAQEL